ncbi:MAG: type II toxin-antitoxin system HicB family antitoxin [Chloroflexi bacterium]|nr:type II toxin-antitoxin system HicB family antitoxin [Chloroflexota bacterium]
MKTCVFRVVVEPDDDRWIAYCPLLKEKGGATWGYTQDEALSNIKEVVEMTVQSMAEHGEPIPDGPSEEVTVFLEANVAVTI